MLQNKTVIETQENAIWNNGLLTLLKSDLGVYDAIRQNRIDFMWKYNIFASKPDKGWDNDDIRIKVIYNNDEIRMKEPRYDCYNATYDEVMNQEVIIMGYDNKVEAVLEVITEYKGYRFITIIKFSSGIPHEDMLLLELLGKVDVEVIPAKSSSVSKTVFCPN